MYVRPEEKIVAQELPGLRGATECRVCSSPDKDFQSGVQQEHKAAKQRGRKVTADIKLSNKVNCRSAVKEVIVEQGKE